MVRSQIKVTERQEADDPIPEGCITLVDAYDILVSIIDDDRSLLPSFSEDWIAALTKSKAIEAEVNDPEVYDGEFAEHWNLRKAVNILLRQSIEAGEVHALVNNPLTAQVLQLPQQDWLPEEWQEFIPSGIWSTYIDCSSYDSPGPKGSQVDGKYRPVFFRRAEFDQWLGQRFPELSGPTETNEATSSSFNSDTALIKKMHLLVERGMRVRPAARQIAKFATGASEDAKVDRLRTKYREAYSSQSPPKNSQ